MKFIQSLNIDFIDVLDFEERPFRAKFVPAKVFSDLDKYRNNPTGLKNYFKKWRFSINYKPEKKLGNNIAVGGWYTIDKNTSELDIYDNLKFKNFDFTDNNWHRFKYRCIQVAMHELIHCKQYMGKHEDFSASKVKYKRTGKKRIDDNREYHAGRDEIEAYAHCIFLDFKMKRPTMSVAEILRKPNAKNYSKNLSGIQRVYKDDRRNEVIPLLFRKILTWERKYNNYK